MKKFIGFSALLAVMTLSVAFVVVPAANAQTAASCPAGYTCTPVPTQPVGCPAGFTCTPTVNPTPIQTSMPAPVINNSCYAWSTNLGIGSRGADVVALQVWLIVNGYDISAISGGRTSRGYYGISTAAAVKQLQAAIGQPITGYVGAPLIAYLNQNACGLPPATGLPGLGLLALKMAVCTLNPHSDP